MALGTDELVWPRDESIMVSYSKALSYMVKDYNEHSFKLIDILSDISDQSRIAWLKNEKAISEATPIHILVNQIGNLGQWSYLKRSLPMPLKQKLDEEAFKAVDRFRTGPEVLPNADDIILCSKVMESWFDKFQRSRKGRFLPIPNSSSKSAIGIPRSGGGMRGWLRNLVTWILDVDVKNKIASTLEDPEECRHETLSSLLSLMDAPFIDHSKKCFDADRCQNPELHFPFEMNAIPERGNRVRCATKPWVSLVYMTEATQKKSRLRDETRSDSRSSTAR